MKVWVANMISQILLPLTLANVAFGSRDFNVKRQITELRDSYDFIIAGGGTTGLTVADRLSAAFPNRKFVDHVNSKFSSFIGRCRE